VSDPKWSDQTKDDFVEVLPILENIKVADYTLDGLNIINIINKAKSFIA